MADEKVNVAMILGPKKKEEEKEEGYEVDALASDLISAITGNKPKDVAKTLKALMAACGDK